MIGLLLAVAVLFILIVVARGGGAGFPWLQFYIKGRESGFKLRELNLLRRVAVENRLKNPTALFWSERQLDRCIKGTILMYKTQGKEKDPNSILFLNKLFDFRKRVEFNLPKYRRGIQSSRSMLPGQLIRITFPGAPGFFRSHVVENRRKHLAVYYPHGRRIPLRFRWKGQRISVYFWRQEDAGYHFDCIVVDEYLDKNNPVLHLTHSETLARIQQRNSIRVAVRLPVAIYPLRGIALANEAIEVSKGYKGLLLNLSEDGAAVLVGGRARPGLALKLQFTLLENVIILSGIVRGINYSPKNNQSILHLQAEPPSAGMRNLILSYVYGIFSESTAAEDQEGQAAGEESAALGEGPGAFEEGDLTEDGETAAYEGEPEEELSPEEEPLEIEEEDKKA